MTKEVDLDRSPNPVARHVGLRIRLRRKELGVSQEKLAESIGLTFQQVQKYERGANRISGSSLVAAARALQTAVSGLVGEDAGEGAPSDEAFAALMTPGAMEMREAVRAVRRPRARQALLALAREMGKD